MGNVERTGATTIHETTRSLTINDPLLDEYPLKKQPGGGTIDSLVADAMLTPLGLRSLDITQLSKAEPHVTIPGTNAFHRYGHVVALAELTQRLARRQGATDRQTLAYVLKSSFSDLAHGPFSHATDIGIQGPGSNETYHESRVPTAFQLGGLNAVFAAHGIKTDERGELPGEDIPPWVESKAPNVCVDRLQYTLHEMLLWYNDSDTPEADEIRAQIHSLAQLENIEIDDDGQMVFTDMDQARLLAKGFLLLSTEHWNEPVNRVQIYLLIESLKYSILSRRLPGMSAMDNGTTRDPHEYLYATDTDVLTAMASEPGRADKYLYAIEGQLADIGREEQRRFTQFKRLIYEQFLTDPLAFEYPSQILNPTLGDYGLASSRFEIDKLKPEDTPRRPRGVHPQVPHLTGENGDLHYILWPLKNRRIDPLVKTNKGSSKLSRLDPRYAELLRQHQEIQRSSLSVHIPTTSTYKDLLWRQAEEVSDRFAKAHRTGQPMHQDPQRRGIEAAAARAIEEAKRRGHFTSDLR